MSNAQNLEKAKQGLGDYLSHLARAAQVQRLLERYLALAPVFIGGPSSTSLDLLPLPQTSKASSPNSGSPVGPWEGLGVHPPPLVPINYQQNGFPHQNGLSHLQQIGMLPRVDFTNKLSHLLQPTSNLLACTVPSNMAAENQTRNQQALENAAAYPQADPVNRVYAQTIFDRMRAVQSATAAAAAAAAAAAQAAQQQQEQHHRRQLAAAAHLATEDRGNFSRPLKRRRVSTGNGRGAGSMNHLSGEMIRKLREQQKVRSAATAAAAVAVAVANATAAASHNGPRPQGHRRREASGKSLPPPTSTTASSTVTSTATQPPPVMFSRGIVSCELQDARLNGQLIPAFNIGGESRLCLPLILRQILGPFHWDQICLACEELQIHIAPCSNNQLIALKDRNILPLAAHQCGLITKSDAERLISFLGMSCAKEPAECDTELTECKVMDTDEVVHVVHECFGRGKGALYPHLYQVSTSKCIKCKECSKMLDPQDFVRHLHSDRENRTCHWGFDPIHWRCYVHLDETIYSTRSKPVQTGLSDSDKEKLSEMLSQADDSLKEMKIRFVHHPAMKRKKTCSTSSILPKVLKQEEDNAELSPNHQTDPSTRDCDTSSPTSRPSNNPPTSPSRKFRPWSNEDQNGADPEYRYPTTKTDLEPMSAFKRIQTNLQYQYSTRENNIAYFNGLSHPVPARSVSRENPCSYVLEVNQILGEEKGLNPKSRDLVTDIINRLAEQVQTAENSRDIVVRELVTLRQRLQNLESELTKKDDELRQLFMMQQVAQVNPSQEISGSQITNGHNSDPLLNGNNGEVIRNISLKRLGLTSTNTTTTTAAINNNNSSNSNTASPLNLSVEQDDSQQGSSIDAFEFKESDDSLKDRMLTIETEIRNLRQKLSDKSTDEDEDDSVGLNSSVEEITVPSNDHTESNVGDVSNLAESERHSLRRTRLHPRRFKQTNSTRGVEDEQDTVQTNQPEENSS